MINKGIRRYYPVNFTLLYPISVIRISNWLRCEDDTWCAFRTRQTPLDELHQRHTCKQYHLHWIFDFFCFLLRMMIVNWTSKFDFSISLFNLDVYKQWLNRSKSGRDSVSFTWFIKNFTFRTNGNVLEEFIKWYYSFDFKNTERMAKTYWSYDRTKWSCRSVH